MKNNKTLFSKYSFKIKAFINVRSIVKNNDNTPKEKDLSEDEKIFKDNKKLRTNSTS